MLLAALVAVATALPQAQDPLDALFARAAATKRLRAEWAMTSGANPEPVVYALDYAAPDRMRLELRTADGVTDMWLLGTVMSHRSTQGGAATAFDVDFAAINAAMRVVEERARAAAPTLAAAWQPTQPRIHPMCDFRWGYDAKTDRGDFRFALSLHSKASMPFGWLDAARMKEAAWTRDGDLLRAETDGRFLVTLTSTGLLQELTGRTSRGSMRFILRSATIDEEPPADRFVVPPAAAAAVDAARAQRQAIESTFRQADDFALRAGLWRVHVAVKKAAADANAAAKIDAEAKLAARVMLEAILAPRVEETLRAVAVPTEEMVAQLVARAGTDRSPENVAQLRAKGGDTIDEGLQRQFETFADLRGERSKAPGFSYRPLERDVIEAIYSELVVDVAVARYEAAFDKAMR